MSYIRLILSLQVDVGDSSFTECCTSNRVYCFYVCPSGYANIRSQDNVFYPIVALLHLIPLIFSQDLPSTSVCCIKGKTCGIPVTSLIYDEIETCNKKTQTSCFFHSVQNKGTKSYVLV